MGCASCPWKGGATPSLDEALAALSHCEHCEIESEPGAGRVVSLLREAGKVLRKSRAEVSRVKMELHESEQGAAEDRARIEKLEYLHSVATRELEGALEQRDELVRRQSEAIRALSAPILEVSEGVLAVPIIGELSEERSRDIMHDLLSAVVAKRAEKVALDVTGVAAMDAFTADRIGALCKAVGLIGARVVLSGLRPDVVSELVGAGVELSAITAVRSLKDAIARRR
jgi:rsbT co-antagonist protein RsbR